MNADELKKELREQARKWWFETPEIALDFMIDELLVPIAEPREKRIAELKARIEKMKCCGNCDNWNWKHNKCEKKLKGDCFKHSKWVMRNF